MTKGELETIRNVVSHLKCGRDGADIRCSPEIAEMLNDRRLRIYLDTWVTGALECLLPEQRDVDLAVRLSR